MDLLEIFGYVTGLPKTLFQLTVLAWGNCLGDMYANVAMTKRGFGEMAITGCLAGPIFNILIGLGLSFSKSMGTEIINGKSWSDVAQPFSLKYENGNQNYAATLPLLLLIA